MSNKHVLMSFINACTGKGIPELARFFTEDCVYHNIPLESVRGPAGVVQVRLARLLRFTAY